jgi:hypothetical protein
VMEERKSGTIISEECGVCGKDITLEVKESETRERCYECGAGILWYRGFAIFEVSDDVERNTRK